MQIDLHGLGLRGGGRYDCTYAITVEPVVLGGTEYQVVLPAGASLTIDRVAGGFVVGLALDGKVYGPCARCLQEVEIPMRTEQQEFAPTTDGDWDEAEMSAFVRDSLVDVGGLAREAIVLALPTQVLCSSTCKGLCPECGGNLNDGPCGCGA